MEENNTAIIMEHLADKFDELERKMEIVGDTMSSIITDMKDLKLRTINLHRRIKKFEDEK